VFPTTAPPEKEKPKVRVQGPVTRRQSIDLSRRLKQAAAAIVVVGVLVTGGRAYYSWSKTPGTVVIESTPRGSEVVLDGATQGQTPLTLQLAPGAHLLEVRRKKESRQFTLNVRPGEQLSQQVDWTAKTTAAAVRTTSGKGSGSLEVSSDPSGARVLIDGKQRGSTPLSLPSLSAGTHTVVLVSKAGTVGRTVQIEPGETAYVDETIFSGFLAVFAPFELDIREGGQRIGTTESGPIMMTPGRHDIELRNAALGYRDVRTVEVLPGETASVNIKAADGIVRITAPAGTEIFVDGARIGVTPLDEVKVAIGTREIVARHPTLGEQRFTTTVTASVPAEVTVDFSHRPR
jgi:hypothetical protein